jgi:hypothetical protein
MVTIENRRPTIGGVPEEELTNAIKGWWNEVMEHRQDDPLATRDTLYDAVSEMDSYSSVSVLLVAEAVLGVELPIYLIKRGGYADLADLTNHLVSAIREHLRKRSNIKIPKPSVHHVH